jgi:soluble lytic murein transglycosylase
MDTKKIIKRTVVIICILALSVLIGFIVQLIGDAGDRNSHPRPAEYSPIVEKYSLEFGVPEYIVYSLILNQSGFESNRVSEKGEIGLTQLSPDTLRWLTSLTKEELDPGILYDPDTNIRYGTYMLSYLYTHYNRWEAVYSAFKVGKDTVEVWLDTPSLCDENGNLKKIPDEETEKFVRDVKKDAEKYRDLYYK